MIRAHKIRLYPNNKQAAYLAKACGVARYAYNWGLDRFRAFNNKLPELKVLDDVKSATYETKKQREAAISKAQCALRAVMLSSNAKFDEAEYRRAFNAEKKQQRPWCYEVTKCAPQLAIKNNLKSAFDKFMSGTGGFPVFHKKGMYDSFEVSNDHFSTDGKYIKLPLLKTPIKMAEVLRYDTKDATILSATISRKADKWYVSINVEMAAPEPIHMSIYAFERSCCENQAIGVDVGVRTLAVLSNGDEHVGNKPGKKYAKRLRRAQQSLSRKVGSNKGEQKSNNYKKQQLGVARLHAKIADSRNDGLHKLTTRLTANYPLIGMEDLNVAGMVKNHKLAFSIQDQAWGELNRQLGYKSEAAGSYVHYSGRFFPSTQLCSNCGYQNPELKDLNVRKWVCPKCDTEHGRDKNSAENLRQDAIRVVFGEPI